MLYFLFFFGGICYFDISEYREWNYFENVIVGLWCREYYVKFGRIVYYDVEGQVRFIDLGEGQ